MSCQVTSGRSFRVCLTRPTSPRNSFAQKGKPLLQHQTAGSAERLVQAATRGAESAYFSVAHRRVRPDENPWAAQLQITDLSVRGTDCELPIPDHFRSTPAGLNTEAANVARLYQRLAVDLEAAGRYQTSPPGDGSTSCSASPTEQPPMARYERGPIRNNILRLAGVVLDVITES
jgi:hypothetical protein